MHILTEPSRCQHCQRRPAARLWRGVPLCAVCELLAKQTKRLVAR